MTYLILFTATFFTVLAFLEHLSTRERLKNLEDRLSEEINRAIEDHSRALGHIQERYMRLNKLESKK